MRFQGKQNCCYFFIVILLVGAQCKKQKNGYLPNQIVGVKGTRLDNQVIRVDLGRKNNRKRSSSPTFLNVVGSATIDCFSKNVAANVLEELRRSKCKPRPTLIQIAKNDKYIPNAVVVNRCSGQCHLSEECFATESVEKDFYIKKSRQCYKITVKEDTACSCFKKKESVKPTKPAENTKCTSGTFYDPSTKRCRSPV